VPVTDITWDLSDLMTGAQIFNRAGRQLSSLAASVRSPNPGMYGTFVANAAALTEPATSPQTAPVRVSPWEATPSIRQPDT